MMTQPSFGAYLREWRGRRRMSQLHLALEADVSQRHVSFLESGRARPSREMTLHLAETLDMPLRDRNALLRAAGFAEAFTESPLDDARLKPMRSALSRMLRQHMPMPAMLFDRLLNLLDANPTAQALFGVPGADGMPDGPPVNLLKLAVGNPAITEQFENWPEIAHYMMARLKLEAASAGGDPDLLAMIDHLAMAPAFDEPPPPMDSGAMVCSRLRRGEQTLSLFSTIAQFGTARDVTVRDLRIELFFPGDEETERAIEAMAESL